MTKYSVRIHTVQNETYVYTTEKNSMREATEAAGLAYRFSGHDTDNITKISVREIR